MALTLLSTPVKTVNGILSNVDGARSQLPYEFQREDTPSNRSRAGAETNYIQAMVESDPALDYAVGDRVYYFGFAGGGGGDYSYSGTVTRVYEVTVGLEWAIEFEVDGAFVYPAGNASAGFVNNLTTRRNYKVVIWVRNPAGVNLIDILFKYSPDPTGYLFLDLGAILTELQEATLASSIEYIIAYNEWWFDNTPSTGFSGTDTIQSIYAEKQLLDVGGANFWDYLLRTYAELSEMVNWVNEGSVMVWQPDTNTWYGITSDPANVRLRIRDTVKGGNILANQQYYMSLDFAYDYGTATEGTQKATVSLFDGVTWHYAQLEDYLTIETKGKRQKIGVALPILPTDCTSLMVEFSTNNGTGLWLEVFDYHITTGKFLTSFKNPVLWLGFTRTINVIIDANLLSRIGFDRSTIDMYSCDKNKDRNGNRFATSFENEVDVQRLTFDEFPFIDRYTKFVEIQCTKNWVDGFISEVMYYEVRECSDNNIYIGWINSKGGFDEWNFSYNQAVDRTVEEGLLAESVINADIENVNRTKKRLPNTWHETMILEADNLTKDQLIALAEIKQSDYVVVNLSKDAVKEVFVVVNNGFETIYDTQDNSFSYTLQIEFPDNFDVFKALEY